MLGPAALAHLRSGSAFFETFQRLRHDLVAIANCLVLATHLIHDTLRDLLIRLGRFQRFLRILNDSPWGRLRGLLSSGFCISILDHITFGLLTAVHMEDDWWRNNYFRVALVRRIALLDGHLNRPGMTFIRNFTTIASAIALTVRASMVFLSDGGVHWIANRFYSTRLHCLLRVSEYR